MLRLESHFLGCAVAAIGLLLFSSCKFPDKQENAESGEKPKTYPAGEPLPMVIDSPYQIWQSDQTKVQVVVFSPDFEPVIGAQVYLGEKLLGQTDRDGTLVFNHQPGGQEELRAQAWLGGQEHSGTVRITSYRNRGSIESDRLFVTTDRRVYQPDEEVLVRAIGWRFRGEFAPIENDRLEAFLQDPQSQPVARLEMTTDAFGVAATRLPIAEDALEGVYRLVVDHGGNQETAWFEVRHLHPSVDHLDRKPPRLPASTAGVGPAAKIPMPAPTRSTPQKKIMQTELEVPVVFEHQQTPITVHIDPDFFPVERVVHLDVTDYTGAMVGAFKIPIQQMESGWLARGAFYAPTWGPMLITLYLTGMRKSDLERGQSVETVGLLTEGLSLNARPVKELPIQLDGVPDQAPPGCEIKAGFKVENPQKEPITALLGVMLLDRSGSSPGDPPEKTPMDHFYNSTLKVLGTTGSETLNWPVVSRNWGQPRYDIALPPFDFLAGGPSKEASKPQAEERIADPGRPETEERETPRTALHAKLPKTVWWEPRLLAERGQATLTFHLPHSLTELELTVVASDQQGRIGFLKKPLRVTQPIFVRSDLPRSIALGDEIEVGVFVQNTAGEEREIQVLFKADGLQVTPAAQKVTVPASGETKALFSIRLVTPGRIACVVEARAGGDFDSERCELEGRPPGEGRVEMTVGRLESGTPFREEVVLGSEERLAGYLDIAFPTVAPALQELELLMDRGAWWAEGHLAGQFAAATVERYLARHFADHPEREQLRAYLNQVAWDLSHRLSPDGGASWWKAGPGSNPYSTAWALRLMAALRDAGIPVDSQTIRRTVAYLRNQQAKDGLWKPDGVESWEGSTEKVRLQISAAVFRSLAEAAQVEDLSGDRWWIEKLSDRFIRYLDRRPDDPLTTAEAALGILALGQSEGQHLADKAKEHLLEAARKLGEMRQADHWEPGWYHTYATTIEATVACLELLSRLDCQAFADELRAGLLYLLSVRHDWGNWYRPFGTAEAIRAFTFLPPEAQEEPATVRVQLGDAEIAKVDMDLRNPYQIALRPGQLSFGPRLDKGPNQLSVHYHGKLQGVLRLLIRRWAEKPEVQGPPPSRLLQRLVFPLSTHRQEAVRVTLHLDARRQPGVFRIVSPIPANARVQHRSLDDLREAPGVLSIHHQADRLEMLVQGSAKRLLSFRLQAVRAGKAVIDPAEATSLTRPAVNACSQPEILIVQP